MRHHHKTSRRLISKIFLSLIGSVLVGCATPRTEVRTVRVEMPVQVPFRAPAVAEPVFAAYGLKKAELLEVKARALLAERWQRIG
ncbi:hypothetical protein V2J93_24640 [Pseudomonas alliivorans]|nr:hypothetical protein [Pseudomonas alliivorans]